MATFSEKMKILMASKNMTQTQAASLFGVRQGSVSDWLNGAMPRRKKIEKISNYFNIDISVLTDNSVNLPIAIKTEATINNIEGLPISDKMTILEKQRNVLFSKDYKAILLAISMLPDEYAIPLAARLSRNGEIGIAQDILFIAGKQLDVKSE